ncbi:hypothetical protein [Pseudomonas sp. HLT2-19-2]
MNTRAIALSILVALSFSGCAFYPVLKSQQDFKPATTAGIPCNTQHYAEAMQCAATLDGELSELTKGVHEYNLFSSYSAWFLGAITGGVLAFDGGEDVLKGLAVAVGSLVGLNAVVKPEDQRKIASAAQKELSCIVSVAEAVHKAQGDASLKGVAAQSQTAIQGIAAARAEVMTSFIDVGKTKAALNAQEVLNLFKAQEQDQQYMVMAKTARDVADSIGSETEIGGKLSKAVLNLRQRVIDQLTANSTINEDAANKQRNLIVGMAGETVKKRADLKKQQEAASVSGDASHELAIKAANAASTGTVSIDVALSDCVDPSTIEALKK